MITKKRESHALMLNVAFIVKLQIFSEHIDFTAFVMCMHACIHAFTLNSIYLHD